jgi:hypothetical protein
MCEGEVCCPVWAFGMLIRWGTVMTANSVDYGQLLSKAADLYSAAPTAFNSIGVAILTVVGFAFWLGGALEKSGRRELEQRLELAREQTTYAYKKRDEVQGEIDVLKAQLTTRMPAPEVATATAKLDKAFQSFVAADNQVGFTLTMQGVGYRTSPEPTVTLPSDGPSKAKP